MNPDGWVILGTKMDNKQLTKDLKQQQQILEEHEKKANELLVYKEGNEKRLAYLEKQLEKSKEFEKEYEKVNDEFDILRKKMDEIYSASTDEEIKRNLELNADTVGRYNELKNIINEMSRKKIEESYNAEKINEQIEKEKENLNNITTELKENLSTQQQISANINKINTQLKLNDIDTSIGRISKSITGVIKKVGRWALAIFGIRGAYMAVRNAINVISQGDEQLKADITYMKNVFAYALEPIVRRIIDLAKQLLYYVAYIIKMWTNYDIFENANKNLKKATGSAKELNKQLAGFDEMNILSDNSSGGGGASSNMNLSDFEAPQWLKLLGKYGKVLLPILGGIFGKLFKLKKLGILIALYGIYETIKNIIDFAHDPNFQSFIGILEGIAITVIGIGTAIGAWPVILAGAIALIILELVKNYDKIKDGFKKLREWLETNVLTWLKDHFGGIGEYIFLRIMYIVDLIEGLFDGVIGGAKKVAEGIVKVFKGDWKEGLKDIFSGLLSILIAPFQAWYDAIIGFIRDLLELFGILSDRRQKSIGGGGSGAFGGGGGGGRAKGGIFYPSKLPKLGIGGIINQPGRGIPYHGATIGERGAEAVVPLTDSQQMALLGEAIGKYISINATVPVYVGNRMVARELKRINAEDNFATNR